MSTEKHIGETNHPAITWQAAIPMLGSTVIIKQFFIVLAASTSCFLVFMLLLELFDGQLTLTSAGNYLLLSLAILVGLFVLGIIGILVIYGNQYEVQFTVNKTGVRSTTIGKTKRKNAVVNTLLALSGKPGPAGTGVLAASRQSELVKWESVDHVITKPASLEIQLCRGKHVRMLIRCTPDNYESILRLIQDSIQAKPI